ncbi:uncharacterized protein DEA37_0009788 [Paragonimus westermani]|uniref:Uncharacterized protein n=1 Tax=Paragonimus westermani TaxID=34504 RepID=A0A5J4NYG6_9TREM|nr:uncharacterized protein DEA37_0009788 [Paragonimus westermani]
MHVVFAYNVLIATFLGFCSIDGFCLIQRKHKSDNLLWFPLSNMSHIAPEDIPADGRLDSDWFCIPFGNDQGIVDKIAIQCCYVKELPGEHSWSPELFIKFKKKKFYTYQKDGENLA